MAGLLASYQSFLSRNPLLGNSVSAAALFATGDGIAQQYVEKKGRDHDWIRTGRIVLWGGGLFAPVVTQWFKILEKVPIKNKVAATATRVGLDQFVFAPIVLTTFFSFMGLLEGKEKENVQEKLKNDLVPTLKANWMVFIPTQAVNMALIPLQYRLLTINLVNIPWNTYLSIQANKDSKSVLKE
ncbi:protein sym1 [Phaffia rhodozyma]|uniref:Protein sym1 n=1 Tax=Phaffia rhodozyma TaxID=264483 RepID=A0A0F7SQA5_PHARH|nr:protein sym1 [Phaffia rhodozyma]